MSAGRAGGSMCETGAMSQIGVFFQQNGAVFLAKKGQFSAISHYKKSDAARYSASLKSQN